MTQLCEAFGISRQAYCAAKKPRPPAKVVAIRRAPKHTCSEVVLAAIREVIKDEPARGVRKVWATLKRQGLKVSRKRVHALMRAHNLVLARDREPGETTRGHVVVPEPNRRFGRRWAGERRPSTEPRNSVSPSKKSRRQQGQ